MTAKGATPEQVFQELAPGAPSTAQKVPIKGILPPEAYETAIALMATCDGNALKSAATARNLAVTTGNPDLYNDVIKSLIKALPWLEEVAAEAGVEW
jgi:hypothetical protein